MPTASEPFLLVRFLCGVPKKMNPDVGPGSDGVVFIHKNTNHNRRFSHRQATGFLYWSKESQQRNDRAGSGHDCSTCKLIDLKVVVRLFYVAVDARWVD